jgi:CHAT domain-containing protein
MDENRTEDYLQLINALVTCPSGQENSLLQNKRELVDETFVLMIRLEAAKKQQNGQPRVARFLLSLAEHLVKELRASYWELVQELQKYSNINQVQGLLENNPNLMSAGLVKTLEQAAEDLSDRGDRTKANFLIDIASQIAKKQGLPEPSPPPFKIEIDFLDKLFSLVAESNGDQEAVYSFLKTKVYLLHEVFPIVLKEWASRMLSFLPPDEQVGLAIVIYNFSLLISYFKLGNQAINLEIAITGHKALSNFFTLEDHPEEYANNQFHLARNQFNLGCVHVNRTKGKSLEDLELAIECFSNALNVFTYKDFPEAWAELQSQLGMVHLYPTWGDQQAESLNKAINYFKAALKVQNPENTPTDWAETQARLGMAYADYADYVEQDRSYYLEKARECYLDALNVYTQNDHPEDWAWIQKHLGDVYMERIEEERPENIESAINCYNAALNVRTKEANPDKWAKTQIALGIAYRHRSRDSKVQNLQNSINCFLEALDVYTQENAPEDWSIVQHNLGSTCLSFAQHEPNIREFIVTEEDRTEKLEQSIRGFLAASQEYIRLGYSKTERWAQLQNSLASAYIYRSGKVKDIETSLKDIEAAIGYLLEALDVFKHLKMSNYWANVQNSLGAAYIQRSNISQDTKNEDIKAAISHFMNALTIHTRDAYPQYYAETQKNLGHIYFKAERYQDAYNAYEEAINTAEALRTQIISGSQSEEDKKKLAEEWKTVYQSMVETCLKLESCNQELEYRNEAIEYVERSKTRNITELIHQRSSSLEQLSPINFEQIKALLDEKTSIVEWYFASGELLVFIITHQCKTPILCKLPFDEALAGLTAEWSSVNVFRSIDNKLQWRRYLVSRLQTLAQELYIDEVLSKIPPNIDKLILIPNIFLHQFPLHALPVSREIWRQFNQETDSPEPTNPCLLDCFRQGVSYTPSCQLLQQAKKREQTNFNNFLGIQDPTDNLPFTNIEVEVVSQYFQSKNILAGQEAAKTNLYNCQLDTAHCVHFGCHGYFNFWKPLNSALILADSHISPPIPEEDSSRYLRLSESEILDLRKCLTLEDVYTLDLRECRLVVLSACETAVSDHLSISDEYISLTSGFLVAGSPSVVATLWTVSDLSTSFLMIKFYQLLKDGLSVPLALNSAQLWLRDVTKSKLLEWIGKLKLDSKSTQDIKDFFEDYDYDSDETPFESPFFWAAFCAIGK